MGARQATACRPDAGKDGAAEASSRPTTGCATLAAALRAAGPCTGRAAPCRLATLAAAVLLAALLLPGVAMAQQLPLGAGGFDNLGGGDLTARTLQIIALVTVLGLAPGLLMMVTCFPFLVTVLAILRQAIGLQQSPPNMLIVSLALFLTWFVMDPVLTEAWQTGLRPVIDEEMSLQQGATAALRPLRGFMAGRIDPATFAALAELRLPPEAGPALAPTPVAPAGLAPAPSPAPAPAPLPDPGTAPLSLLVPSFMLSEIRRAFEIGFLIYLPFLIIDLVVSAVLMSMGMMMVPPSVVSMPFKLAFFVVADGWALLSAALVRSYV